MQNKIHLLSDAIANQIAAGEVVQRPASVVKELLENAIDAGATRIDLRLKQAGKTLIQVSDNGAGMSAQDARMAFERHATSKISTQDDLFGIRTLGFRGEALASIAAVAQVNLKTRLQEEEIGLELELAASKIEAQRPWAGPGGSIFSVKNLFYNVPARRNFLKSNPVETRHILNQFTRIALSNPQVHLCLHHNDAEVYDLLPGTESQRLRALFGADLEGQLHPIAESSGYVQLAGLLGDPALARKKRGEQFFFVNGRYIKSNYLHHAVATAYEPFLPKDTHPLYLIRLDLDPVHVDINIHPTKTEVKFDDERTLYVLLHGLVKKTLGEAHHAPALPDEASALQQEIYQQSPFTPEKKSNPARIQLPKRDQVKPEDWQQLFTPPPDRSAPPTKAPESWTSPPPRNPQKGPDRDLFGQKPQRPQTETDTLLTQFQLRYILTQSGEALLIVDQHLAHQRILFERFLRQQGAPLACQQLLFPQTLGLNKADYSLLWEAEPFLGELGFEVKEFGQDTLIVYGTPPEIPTGKITEIFDEILAELRESGASRAGERIREGIARAVAMRSAVTSHQKLSILEMKRIVEGLFQCEVPGFAPNGKPTYKRLTGSELETFFR